MDKKTLNNEIILCRPAVRKAKVIIIRKILKKMKILKGCKIEAVKEKKLKKSERLFEKVQMIKKIKVDDVTKFALRNNDLKPFLEGPVFDLRQNVLAKLAQYDAVEKKVNSIREQIPNWETELPAMLDSLGKKKKKLNLKKKTVKSEPKGGATDVKVKEKVTTTRVKENVIKPNKSPKVGISRTEKHKESETKKILESPTTDPVKIEKVDDPFFIEKKIIAPKLLLEKDEDEKFRNNEKPRKSFSKRETNFEKPFKTKREPTKFKKPISVPTTEEEKLHPSWAAKKVKLIKPFEGKKIKFQDE